MRATKVIGVLAAWALAAPAMAQRLEERPIRGMWLRPIASTSVLDTLLNNAASAGVTDLFLETFYHGLATHDSSVFNDRFTTDVLADNIERARRRGIRVHAWLEAAYWSFGGSGNYILNANPEWKVTDDDGATNIGDQSGQVFVNLGHPGVQAKLADLCTELAANYPMLWGIHTDYHRFPLDNDTGDNQNAPFSFDAWSRSAFQAQFGVDPLTSARLPGQPFYNQFVDWRRLKIAEAAGVMHDAILAADSGKQFSGAVFATAIADRFGNANPAQLEKMQDWPRMAANGWLPIVVPMAYGTSTTSIRNDLQAANNQANGARIVAGLAIINPTTRPGVAAQLGVVYGEGLDSFVFFEGNLLLVDANRRAELATFLDTNGPYQSADFNQDARVDGLDWDQFYATYMGVPLQGGGALDLDGDRRVDADDEAIFLRQFRAWRFGADGVVGEAEYAAVLAAFTAPGESRPLDLFDLTADGVIDCEDVARLRRLVNAPVSIATNADITGDGAVNGADAAAFITLAQAGNASADLDDNGARDFFDVVRYLEIAAAGCP